MPVDACTTAICKAGGSASLNGLYTSASFVPYTNNTVDTVSFPLATVVVQLTPGLGPAGGPPPPPPPTPPPFAIAAPTAVGIPQQIGIGNNVGVGNLSLQAASAGFLGAGFVRVQMKNRPIAMKMAARSGFKPAGSRFDAATKGDSGVGKFE